MDRAPTNAEKIRALPWSIGASAANTVFLYLTFFGSVFVLFLSELGLNKSQIGLLLSFLPFSALIAPFIAPRVASFGYKRTFLLFWVARKVTAAFLLLTPWVTIAFGSQPALVYVAGVVAVFALGRSVAMTAQFPWAQEYVPDSVRGKYTATTMIVTALVGLLAVSGARYTIGYVTGLGGFMLLFAVGVVFGLVSAWAFSLVPGGGPLQGSQADEPTARHLRDALRDRNFLLYLSGAGLVTLATTPMISFVPLFMQEQVGLDSGNVVFLQAGTLLGGVLSSYLWGWSADRYGGKPVMLSGVSILAFLPVCWLLMPRESPWSLHVGLAIAFLQGLGNLGWAVGFTQILFVSAVPPEKKTDYMALYYASVGAMGGISQVVGGRVLDFAEGVTGQFLIFPLDQFTILFVAGFMLALISIWQFNGVHTDGTVSMGEFAGMFLRGNPFLAAESLIRYRLSRGERATVSTTERMGQAKSPLTVDELLETLSDPRFNVRFEAIVSIARMGPDDRLREALVEILRYGEPAYSVMAAWALGRMGDEQALTALREGLESEYRSIQAHSARSLGTLRDGEIVPELMERLRSESDKGLRLAYASALGKLGVGEGVGDLLEILRSSQDEDSRMELVLALARIVGDEPHFIQLWREARGEAGTATSQAMTSVREKIDGEVEGDEAILSLMDDCARVLGEEDLERGAALISQLIILLPCERFEKTCGLILQECAQALEEFGAARFEYELLALHAIYVGWMPIIDL